MPNGLRHSIATQRLNEGYSIGEIKELLRHTDIRTTERYTVLMTNKKADIMRSGSVHSKNTENSHESKNICERNLKHISERKWLGDEDSNQVPYVEIITQFNINQWVHCGCTIVQFGGVICYGYGSFVL
jgi:hypothetical protein